MTTDPKFENDHNVYIIGAGFSTAASLPVMSNFMSHLRACAADRSRTKSEREATTQALTFRLRAAAAGLRVDVNLDNLEELFSLAAADSTDEEVEWMRTAIAATLASSYRDPNRVLLSMPSSAHSSELAGVAEADTQRAKDLRSSTSGYRIWDLKFYEFVVGGMLGLLGPSSPNRQNTFVTFNYDTLVEEALTGLGLGFDYGVSTGNKLSVGNLPGHKSADRGGISVLKIHGSVNWAYPGGRGQQLTAYPNYAAVSAANLSPYVVPPTWKKTFDHALADVWDSALRSLRTATRIVIMGFSIPPTDLHFKYLLAAGLMHNISLEQAFVFDPYADTIADRSASTLRNRPDAIAGFVQNLVQLGDGGVPQCRALFDRIGRPVSGGLQLQR